MTQEKQRIAIARACGWTVEQDSNGYWRSVSQHHGKNVTLWLSERNVWSQGIPDYLNDLNACHEMEQALTHEQRIDYMEWLGLSSDEHWYKVWAYVHATAPERCTAFIRTLGLWEKEEQ